MIKDYENKMTLLYINQKGKCSGCGKQFGNIYIIDNNVYCEYGHTKLDFAHELPRTKKNIKKYPLFIDSIENASIQHNHCNVKRKPPYWKTGEYKKEKPINYYQAEQIEKRMRDELNDN